MKKFYAIYKAPVSVIQDWMKNPEAERKAMEAKMKGEWDTWLAKNSEMVKETAGLGKKKQVTGAGITDTSNDLMMYSLVEADSADAVAKIFEDHPHLQIPQSSIDIMEANILPRMQRS